MRNAGCLKLGYYPLPIDEARNIRSQLVSSAPIRFRVQPSWRLPVHRVVTHAEKHLPRNCRYSERATEQCVQGNQASLTLIHIWR